MSANALAADLHLDQVGIVQQLESAEVLELDPLLQVTAMDDTVADVERETFAQNHPGIEMRSINDSRSSPSSSRL